MLRVARATADMTQQELADHLGVSLRSIGNWERGPVVPAKYWAQIRTLFPDLITEESRRALVEEMLLGRNRLKHETATSEGIDNMVALVEASLSAIHLAEMAVRVGVHPAAVIDLVQGTINIVLDSGAITLPLPGGDTVYESVVNRGSEIASRAVEQFTPPKRRGHYLEMAAQKAQLREKDRYVGAPVQDDLHAADLRDEFDLAASDDASAVDPNREP